MDNSENDFKALQMKPRPIFLVLSLLFIIGAVLIYMFDDFILGDQEGSMAYVLALIICILLSTSMLMCYRNPKLGNKLLGYDVADQPLKNKRDPAVFSTGFHFDSALTEKKIATRRREGRANRKKYAKATKAMQQQQAEKQHNKE